MLINKAPSVMEGAFLFGKFFGFRTIKISKLLCLNQTKTPHLFKRGVQLYIFFYCASEILTWKPALVFTVGGLLEM